jgi:hypothetical protein
MFGSDVTVIPVLSKLSADFDVLAIVMEYPSSKSPCNGR